MGCSHDVLQSLDQQSMFTRISTFVSFHFAEQPQCSGRTSLQRYMAKEQAGATHRKFQRHHFGVVLLTLTTSLLLTSFDINPANHGWPGSQ